MRDIWKKLYRDLDKQTLSKLSSTASSLVDMATVHRWDSLKLSAEIEKALVGAYWDGKGRIKDLLKEEFDECHRCD